MPTAEVETHTPPPVAPPPAPEVTESQNKRRAGRRAPYQETTEESSADEQLGYFQQTAEIPEVDWERTCQYLYRWRPFYDNSKGGIEPKYVCLYTNAVTVDQIKREHGSGRYNLKLNQRQANEKSDRTIRQVVFDIVDPAFPPNLPEGDWKTDPRNKNWVFASAHAPVAGPQGNGTSAVASTIKDVQSMIQTLYPDIGKQQRSGVEAELVKILPALLEQRNGQQLDPLALITTIVTLMKQMMPAPVAPPPADNTMTQFLLKQIESMDARTQIMQQQFIELLKQKTEPAKQPDAMEILDKMTGIFGKVSEVRDTLGGGGTTSRMNGWQEVASNVGTELIKHVGPALPFMLQPRPQQARPAGPRPLPAPGAPAPGAPPPAAAAPAPNPAVATDETQEEEMNAASFLAQALQNNGLVGPLLTYFNDGETGLDFAIWVVNGHGAMPLNMIKGQGKAVVMQAITEHLPQLYAQLQPNWGKFDLFVDSFLSWTPDMMTGDDDDEDDEAPAPVAAAPPPAPPSGTPRGGLPARAERKTTGPTRPAGGKK